MNRKQLTYFMEAYRTRNIQAAADAMFISHQGLSRVLRSLEEELGQPLFLRSNKGLVPTDFATSIVPHIRSILDGYDRIEGIHTLASQNKSVVTVYSLDHILGFLGPEFICAFHETHPDVTLSVVDTTDAGAWEALDRGECDCALVNGPMDETRFEGDALFYSRFCVRMRKDHPLAAKDTVAPADMEGQDMIGKGRAYDCFRKSVETLLLGAGVNVSIPVETPDEELLQDLVEGQNMLAVTYDFSARDHLGKDTVVRYMDSREYGQNIYLARKRDSTSTAASRQFRRFLLQWMEEHPWNGLEQH